MSQTWMDYYNDDYKFRRMSVQFTNEQADAIRQAAKERGVAKAAVVKDAIQQQLVDAS